MGGPTCYPFGREIDLVGDIVEPSVTFDDIVAGLDSIGARGRRIIVHASLSAFGRVAGGAETVVSALLDVAETVLVPTFTYSAAAVPPPDDRPVRNGADYDRDRLGDEDPTPFTPDLEAAKSIGIVPDTLRRRPEAIRSDHPLSSFAAVGRDAGRYVTSYDWDDPMQPLQRLLDDGGYVLMLGTVLTSCTTVHLGEQHAGRRPFIRWAKTADGRIHRVRVGGCSQGFEKLAPWVEGVRETQIGQARVRMFSVRAVIEASVRRLAEDAYALVCSPHCRRCLDAAEGGPQD